MSKRILNGIPTLACVQTFLLSWGQKLAQPVVQCWFGVVVEWLLPDTAGEPQIRREIRAENPKHKPHLTCPESITLLMFSWCFPVWGKNLRNWCLELGWAQQISFGLLLTVFITPTPTPPRNKTWLPAPFLGDGVPKYLRRKVRGLKWMSSLGHSPHKSLSLPSHGHLAATV